VIFELARVEHVHTPTDAVLLRVHGTWHAAVPATMTVPDLLVRGPAGTLRRPPVAAPPPVAPQPTLQGTGWTAGFGVPAVALVDAELSLITTIEGAHRHFPLPSAGGLGSSENGTADALSDLVAGLARCGHSRADVQEALEGGLGLRVGDRALEGAFRRHLAH
jgi:hypothetical protein